MIAPPREVPRGTSFDERLSTAVWAEVPDADNPYLAAAARCRGYDVMELARGARATAALLLLFTGELPAPDHEELFEAWWITALSPGPRHPATRAAMAAAIGGTHAAHVLPIGLAVLGGAHLGAMEVLAAMRWLTAQLATDPAGRAAELLAAHPGPSTPAPAAPQPPGSPEPPAADPGAADVRLGPGVGTRFGGADPLPRRALALLAGLRGAGRGIAWAAACDRALAPHGVGWLSPGVAAACFHDLGLSALHAVAVYQWACAPGLIAHGNELLGAPLTRMPFPSDADYVVERGPEPARSRVVARAPEGAP